MKTFGPALLLFCSLLLSFSFSDTGTDVREFTKSIEKEFPIASNGNASIINRHGKVEMKTWDENKVRIKVLIRVNTRGEEDAQKVFERVAIQFDNDENHVSAETVFDRLINRYWNKRFRDLSIDYEVFLPATNNLRVKQSHGKVYVQDIKGNAQLRMSHADFWAGDVGGDLEVKISHGKGQFGDADNVSADLSHAKLEGGKVKDLDIDLSHSTLTAAEVGTVKSSSSHSKLFLDKAAEFSTYKSSHDRIEIQSADKVKVNGGHNNVLIQKVNQSLSADMSHGSCRVGLSGDAAEVDLTGSHTTFKVTVRENVNFRMDAQSQHAGIHYPAEMQINYLVEKNSNRTVRGYYGSENASSLLKAQLSHGSLTVDRL